MTSIKSKKPRDTRTHDERISALYDAFERSKIRANAKGLKNECSIVKVCEQAGINDTYLHTHKIKNDEKIGRAHV